MQQRFDIDTDHFQFYLGDRELGPQQDTTHLWDVGGHVVTLQHLPFLVGIATARYGGQTPVEIEVAERRPITPKENWEEMGSFLLQAPSGSLILWAPENLDLTRAPSVLVQPGEYDGLVFSRGTNNVTDEMMPHGPDEYRVVLWRRGA